MANKATIKTYFETGDVPTQAQFEAFIDGTVFWDGDVETTLGTTDTKVPTSKAVSDQLVYEKDANNNVFYRGVTAILGAGSSGNIFDQNSVGNESGTDCIYNIFNSSGGNILGNDCAHNIFNSSGGNILGNDCAHNIFNNVSGNVYGNNLRNVTIQSGNVGGSNYTASPDYDFMYGNNFPATIISDGATDYWSYYDVANSRIELRNLTTLEISYIGLPPINGEYANQAAMIAAQANQKTNFIYWDGTSFWQKLSTNTGLIADYRQIGGIGSAAWGSITGTLSDQTDLQTALNGKQASLGFTPENVANKQTDLTASATKYPTVDAVNTGLATRRKQIQSTGIGTVVTGTTSNTFCKEVLIPANTFAAGDIPMITIRTFKSGTAGIITTRVYANTTSGTIAGGVLMATNATTAGTNLVLGLSRNIAIQATSGANNVVMAPVTVSNSIEEAQSTSAESSLTIDWSVNQYIQVGIQLAAGSDSGNVRYILIN